MSKDENRPPKGSGKKLYDAIHETLLGRGHVLAEVSEAGKIGARKGWEAGFNVDGIDVPIFIEEERRVRHSYHFHYTGNLIVRCNHLWGPQYGALMSSKTFRASKSRKENFGIDVPAIVKHIDLYVRTAKESDAKQDQKKRAKKDWGVQLGFLTAKYQVPDWLTLTATEKGIELEGLTGISDLEKILKAISK